jgi:hypothetical protein
MSVGIPPKDNQPREFADHALSKETDMAFLSGLFYLALVLTAVGVILMSIAARLILRSPDPKESQYLVQCETDLGLHIGFLGILIIGFALAMVGALLATGKPLMGVTYPNLGSWLEAIGVVIAILDIVIGGTVLGTTGG